ncbi:hypothetical protein HIM_07711 [Hirsutella minnesotensis 3608]|uniref:Pre-rRNA-processing protein RIX1 n=1 Tax=Hirsutella minnesotensis 3608 TaxID=1043627 RepID=A0A0F7ZTE0_9HYPO|nr:hypothetical protein HIM_07711 [Hirsutella minnesotensis 3608]
MSSQAPPDLRVICRKISSIPPTQLPHALPALTTHIARCSHVLSASQEQKPKGDASQVSVLVHKLKTGITTLLTSRTPEARFAAIGLVKAMVDVGGWETLRGSGPWVRALLTILQRGDSFASKEMAIITLARIYMLVQPYQTLVREIATPTIPDFAKACLQIMKPTASESIVSVPFSMLETICDAFSTLIPLFPATFRPFSSRIRSATRDYLAPTSSDGVLVPNSLQRAAGRLVVSLHHVAAKSGGSDEWAKTLDGTLRELHATADQVFRAVDEAWQSSDDHGRSRVDPDGEPHGGSASADQLPPWTGLSAGIDRLIGLFNHLGDYLRCSTKVSVTVPVGSLLNAISRVCLIAKLSPKTQNWDQAVETNAAIGREEKEELWSLMPEVHAAAMGLALVMLQRFDMAMVPLVPELTDHLVRIFKSGMDIPTVRVAGYLVLRKLLSIAGPTLPKPAVVLLEPLVAACCRDLQQDAGYLKPSSKEAASAQDTKKNGVANADLFLQPSASATEEYLTLAPHHKAAVAQVLPLMFSSLPQQHLKPNLRSLLDKTSILTRNREAMLHSVLHPFKDQRGRMYPSILPHLSRQFPHDQALEVLRSNLRVGSVLEGASLASKLEPQEDDSDAVDEAMGGEDAGNEEQEADRAKDHPQDAPLFIMPQVEDDVPAQSNPFAPRTLQGDIPSHSGNPADLQPKRKHEGPDPQPPKRQELDRSPPAAVTDSAAKPQDDEDDDDSDVSVHLNMELEEDDDEEEDEG